MTQEEKRIKLCEFAGWKGILKTYLVGYAPWRPVTYEERIQKTPVMEFHSIPLDPLPDYFGDLNAVHELVWARRNDRDFVQTYSNKLRKVVGDSEWSTFSVENATAAQRAEAIGGALSLWTE